ncbi:MAG: hypothetical protein WBQ60_09600 [Asticcacaulis sp.]
MDLVLRTNSGGRLVTPPIQIVTPRGMSKDKFATEQTSNAHKDEVARDVSKALSNPSFKAQDQTMGRAKEKIQNIVKRLKILKALFANDPKQMAKALAQVFKELKAAVKDYKSASEKEMGLSASAAALVVPPEAMSAAPAAPVSDESVPDKVKADAPATDTLATDTPDAKSSLNSAASYDDVVKGVRQTIGSDGLEFIKTVRGIVQEIEDKIISKARIQKLGKPQDKDTDDTFKEMDEAMKDLRKDLEDMESDIKRDAPGIGQSLDIAA